MHRFIGAVALAALAWSTTAAAEEASSERSGPKNVLSFAPTGLVSGLVALEYERVVTDHLSLTFAPDVRFFQGPDGVSGGSPFGGDRILGLAGGLRWFMLGRAPSGLWLQPEVGTVMGLTELNGQTVRGDAVPRFAATLGATGVVGGWLSLSAGAGLQMISYVPMPNLRLNVGVAF